MTFSYELTVPGEPSLGCIRFTEATLRWLTLVWVVIASTFLNQKRNVRGRATLCVFQFSGMQDKCFF